MSSTCITSTTIAGAGQHSFHACLRYTSNRGCRPTLQIPVQRCSPLLVQCRSIVYDADPSLIYHQVCCILCASTCHSTNTVSILTHSPRRWTVIETALGDCTFFSECCIMLVTFKIPAPETNTRQHDTLAHCWCNAEPPSATLGQHYSYQTRLSS